MDVGKTCQYHVFYTPDCLNTSYIICHLKKLSSSVFSTTTEARVLGNSDCAIIVTVTLY